MSRRADNAILQDMQGAITRIVEYTQCMDYSTFLSDIKTQDAVVRNLEILGEAAKLLSDAAKANMRDVPWKEIAGTRDRLIHDYFGVNLDIVWNIITVDIPQIKSAIEC